MLDKILIDMPMPIETPRLIIRPVMPGDGAAIHAAKQETWDHLCLWMPWTKEGLGTVDSTEKHARQSYANFILRGEMFMIGFEKASQKPVVFTGFHDPDWDARVFSTGYWVRASAQGRGYATEACNALLRYAFNVLAAQRVGIEHADGNDSSHHVIRKLGFVKEGILRQACALPDGRLVDEHVYSRLNIQGLPTLELKIGGLS